MLENKHEHHMIVARDEKTRNVTVAARDLEIGALEGGLGHLTPLAVDRGAGTDDTGEIAIVTMTKATLIEGDTLEMATRSLTGLAKVPSRLS